MPLLDFFPKIAKRSLSLLRVFFAPDNVDISEVAVRHARVYDLKQTWSLEELNSSGADASSEVPWHQ